MAHLQQLIALWLVAALSVGITEASYLDRPRFHFSGKFQADPSTVNNEIHNFQPHTVPSPHWNPNGTGDFRFYDTRVTSVTYLDGTHSQNDPIVGLPVLNTAAHTAGKIVDIDVEIQLNKSQLWGYHTSLNWRKPGPEQYNGFKGYITPSCLANNVWRRGICFEYKKILTHLYGSVLKSVLTDVTWADKIDSPLLKQLRSTTMPKHLSVRLVLYFYVNNNHSTTNFTFGNVQGTIGPAFPDESIQFPEARTLSYQEVDQPPPSFFPHLTQCQDCKHDEVRAWVYDVPFSIVQVTSDTISENITNGLRAKLVADFGNAITMDRYQNLLNLGTLALGVYDRKQHCMENLGFIDYQQENWLQTTTGIQEFPSFPREWELSEFLTDVQLEVLRTNPVVVVHISHAHHPHSKFSPDPEYQPEMQVLTKGAHEIPIQFCWRHHPHHHHHHHHHHHPHLRIILKEEVIYVRPWNEFIFRMNHGEENTLKLFVTKYGRPLGNGAAVNLFPSVPREPSDGVTIIPNKEVETDKHGIATFKFRANCVGQPRNHLDGQVYRFLYNVTVEQDADMDYDVIGLDKKPQKVTPINEVTVLVFSNVSYEQPYTWVDDVEPIFQQYAQLFPVMNQVLDLSYYRDVKRYAKSIHHVLSLNVHHPSYMPVTRDLSKAKREMILEWLENGCLYDQDGKTLPHKHRKCVPAAATWEEEQQLAKEPPPPLPKSCKEGFKAHTHPKDSYSENAAKYPTARNLSADESIAAFGHHWDCMNVDWIEMAFLEKHTIQDLHCLLQTAIRLEFSTIPPYLTALFSIIDGCNREVERLIRSVVMQEMLHMSQAANLLIALGGNPVINSEHFVPTYPGRLPGGVLPNLRVHLRKATKSHIHRNFMAIEYPRKTKIGFHHPIVHENTIGEFYAFIRRTIRKLYWEHKQEGKELFCKGSCIKNQVRWPTVHQDTYGGTLYIVKDLETANEAIREIIEQGEGVGPFNPSDGLGDELAHYYKFAEIVCGHELKDTDGTYKFNGAKIELDEAGVYHMRDDPSIKNLEKDTNAYHFSKVFNEIYRQLLNRLHETFNGKPEGFRDSVSIMWSLKMYAKRLMTIPVGECQPDGPCETAGPSWELDT